MEHCRFIASTLSLIESQNLRCLVAVFLSNILKLCCLIHQVGFMSKSSRELSEAAIEISDSNISVERWALNVERWTSKVVRIACQNLRACDCKLRFNRPFQSYLLIQSFVFPGFLGALLCRTALYLGRLLHFHCGTWIWRPLYICHLSRFANT